MRFRLTLVPCLSLILSFSLGEPVRGEAAETAPRYSGQPLMRVFTEREIGGAPRNHAVAVHPSGLIYVANDVGLREFDGATWRVIAGTERLMIFGVAIDAAGRVYYCGPHHFGVLVVSPDGTLTARPLHRGLAEADRAVGDVRDIVPLGENVYFNLGARNAVVRVDAQGGVHFIRLPERVLNFLTWAGRLYAANGEHVYRIEGDTVTTEREPPLGLQTFGLGKIYAAGPLAEGGAWLLARNGLWRWQTGAATPVSDDVARLLGADSVVSGSALGDGTFALGTRAHGLLIVGSDGRVLARYGEDNGNSLGLGSGYVEGLTMDAAGGLWVAHDGGVTRVDVRNPGAAHGPALGLRGRQVFALALHRGRLHVGTSQGIFVRDPGTGRFTQLKGAPGNIGTLISTEEGLIAATERLALFRDNGEIETIDSSTSGFSTALRLPRDPDRIVASTAGGAGGLRVYRRTDGRWQLEGTVAGARERLQQLTLDDAGWLWAVRDPSRIVRVDWRKGVRFDAAIETVGANQGLPAYSDTQSVVQLVRLGGAVTVASQGSLLRHEPASDRFVPDNRIEGLTPAEAIPALFALGDESWLLARGGGPARFGFIRPTGPGRWSMDVEPWSGFEALSARVVLPDPATHTLWLGGQQLISYDLGQPRIQRAPPVARVRRVTTTEQKDLWNGAGAAPVLVLPPEQNSLNFSFAAASPQTNAKGQLLVGYRTRLDGFDRDWSAWGLGTTRTYTNLPPGSFVFRVEASREDFRTGPEAVFTFQLQTPWWSTWWFLGIASVSGIGSVAGVTRWLANRALRRRLQLLEAQSAVERERLRLARDLHDEVGSGLGRVILFAGEARRHQGDPARLGAALDRVRETAQDLVQHAREIVWAVSPQHDTLASVIERLGDYTEETLRAAGIACHVETPAGAELPAATLGSEARHSLFLAVKEAVHNSVKYSGAKTAEFRLQIAAQQLVVTLRDHGCGFAPGEMRGTGHGLVNLAARAKVLGGDATITSAVGQGTTVTLRVPLGENTQRLG